MRDELKRAGLADRVRFAGQVEETAEVLAFSTVMLTTPRSEGLGLAAMEALAAGVPVVCPKVGGLAEVVRSGENGFLVEDSDPRAFADAVRGLFNDEAMRTRFSEAGRSLATASFGWEPHVAALVRLYAELRGEEN